MRFSRDSSAAVPSAIIRCTAVKAKPPRRPSAGSHRRNDAFAQTRWCHDEAERQARRHFLRKAVEHDAPVGCEHRQRRFVIEERVDIVFDDGEVEFLDDAQQIGAARRRHCHAQRILDDRLNVKRGQMRFAVSFLHGVRTNAVFIHRQRHQRHAEPGGDALDEGIGQRLDPAASAGRHHGRKRGGDALPAVGGEDDLLGAWRPAIARQDTPPKCLARLAFRCWSPAATPASSASGRCKPSRLLAIIAACVGNSG